MKLDNIIVFHTERPEYSMYGMIARLLGFGFSINTSSIEGFAKLIGWTPIWAAPKAGEIIMMSNLHLTNIYSTGFII
jgi:hypothetical protein